MNLSLSGPLEWIGGLAVRALIGMGFGVLGAVVGYFAGWMALAPGTGLSAATAYITTGTGVGAGAGSLVGWLDLERSKLANLPLFLLTVGGGLLGAWGGLAYAAAVYDVDVKTQDARITAVAGAAFAANLIPALWRSAARLSSRRRR